MNLLEDDYIHTYIYGEFEQNLGNMTFIFIKRNGSWMGEWRNRYYSNNDEEDRKTSYSVDCSHIKSEQEVSDLCRKLVNDFSSHLSQLQFGIGKIDFEIIEIKGSPIDFIDKIKDRPWANIVTMKKDSHE